MATKKQGSRVFLPLLILIGTIFIANYSGQLSASDPPHSDVSPGTDTGWCSKCHTPHSQLGTGYGVLARVEGNANLCISCHNTGGRATDKPFINSDQSDMANSRGSSHRWDSGVAGYVYNYSVTSATSGRIISGIIGGTAYSFIGTTPRIYQITISKTGDATGTAAGARFDWKWSQNSGVAWTNTIAGVITLTTENYLGAATDYGQIKLKFVNASPPSFAQSTDIYRVYVRPEIRFPNNAVLASRMFKDPYAGTSGVNDATGDSYRKVVCSTCHNQHRQANPPSDPTSTTTSTTAPDRHFQRIRNATDTMCLDCHSIRSVQSVTTYTGGNLSHPVGISLPATATFHTVPYEAAGATTPQTQFSYRGSETTGGGTLTLVDNTKNFNTTGVIGKTIRFTSSSNKGTTKSITSANATSVSWGGAVTALKIGDKYEIDADGNLSNSMRFYNPNTSAPSFTAGQVLCLSCHNMHWADSNDTTADCDGC